MTAQAIIAGVLEREGGFVHHPADKGGPTKFGITAAVLGEWRRLGRQATRAEVAALEAPEATDIYFRRFILGPNFTPLYVPFEPLRVQLIDFGINSGPARAIRWLQRVLRLPPSGVLDGETRQRLQELQAAGLLPLVNDALVAARCYMVDRWTDADERQKPFEEGVESRALGFFLAAPEEAAAGPGR
jgi:lysozyme family protein